MLTAGMDRVERHLHLARALMTGSAPRFEQQLDVVVQIQQWKEQHGNTLEGAWFSVRHPGGQERFVYGRDDYGTGTWERPADAQIVATFTIRPDARLISRRLARLAAEPSSMTHEARAYLDAAAAGSHPDFNAQLLVSLAERNSVETWGIHWPRSGVAPINAIYDWLVDQRGRAAVDGHMMAGLRMCVDLWNAIATSGAAELVLAETAKPLRGLINGLPLAILRETVRMATATGQVGSVIDCFNAYLALAEDGLAATCDADGLDGFHESVYEHLPVLIAIVTVADALCEPGMPISETTVRKIKEKRGVTEEHRARLLDAVEYHARNLISNDVVWRHHVDLVGRAAGRSVREARRLVDRLVEQAYIYPRSVGRQLLAEAGITS